MGPKYWNPVEVHLNEAHFEIQIITSSIFASIKPPYSDNQILNFKGIHAELSE